MDASYKIQRGIHVHLIQFFMCPEFWVHITRVEYRKVYFRIRSRYQFDSGWPAETDAAKFHEESRSLFQSAGWDLQPGGDSTSDTVTKGWQELYCIR